METCDSLQFGGFYKSVIAGRHRKPMHLFIMPALKSKLVFFSRRFVLRYKTLNADFLVWILNRQKQLQNFWNKGYSKVRFLYVSHGVAVLSMFSQPFCTLGWQSDCTIALKITLSQIQFLNHFFASVYSIPGKIRIFSMNMPKYVDN